MLFTCLFVFVRYSQIVFILIYEIKTGIGPDCMSHYPPPLFLPFVFVICLDVSAASNFLNVIKFQKKFQECGWLVFMRECYFYKPLPFYHTPPSLRPRRPPTATIRGGAAGTETWMWTGSVHFCRSLKTKGCQTKQLFQAQLTLPD